jgi:hypothetical protein
MKKYDKNKKVASGGRGDGFAHFGTSNITFMTIKLELIN